MRRQDVVVGQIHAGRHLVALLDPAAVAGIGGNRRGGAGDHRIGGVMVRLHAGPEIWRSIARHFETSHYPVSFWFFM